MIPSCRIFKFVLTILLMEGLGMPLVAQQRDPLRIMADAHVRDGSSNQNFGTAPVMELKSDNPGWNRQIYLRVGLTGLDEAGLVLLRLGVTSIAGDTATTRYVLEEVSPNAANINWAENSLTWNNRPTAIAKVLQEWQGGSVGQTVELDITEEVLNSLQAGRNQLNLRLRSFDAGAQRTIGLASKENSNLALRPTVLWFNANVDSDQDGLPDYWETVAGLNRNLGSDAHGDMDQDGLDNLEEYALGTDPGLADTDGDGFDDRAEQVSGTDPLDEEDFAGVKYADAARILADGFVRDGSYANANYGGDTQLMVKNDGENWTRRAYLKINLLGLEAARAVKLGLMVTGISTDTESTRFIVEQMAHASNWQESSLTWNNRPGDVLRTLGQWQGGVVGEELVLSLDSALQDLPADGIVHLRIRALDAGSQRMIYLGTKEHGLPQMRPRLTWAVPDPTEPDSDGDGLPDPWEIENGLDPNLAADAENDPDGDFLSNLQEYHAGTNPSDYYNGATPLLSIVSGNNQVGGAGNFTALPLVVEVRDSTTGFPMVNAPVRFVVVGGGSALAPSTSGAPQTFTSLILRTDGQGRISNTQHAVFARLPMTASSSISVTAVALSGNTPLGMAATFTATNFDPYTPPAAPGNLSALEQQDGSVVLNWRDNSDNETGFTIERSSDGGQTWQQVVTMGANTTNYTHNNGGGSNISYRVSASNGAGSTASSAGGGTAPVPEPGEDWDGDSLINSEEAEFGGDPRDGDTDNDGVGDAADAVVYDADFVHPRTPLPRYALIDITADFPGLAADDLTLRDTDTGERSLNETHLILNNLGSLALTVGYIQPDSESQSNPLLPKSTFRHRSWFWKNGQAVNLDFINSSQPNQGTGANSSHQNTVCITGLSETDVISGHTLSPELFNQQNLSRTTPFRWSHGTQQPELLTSQQVLGLADGFDAGFLNQSDGLGNSYGMYALTHGGDGNSRNEFTGFRWASDGSVQITGQKAFYHGNDAQGNASAQYDGVQMTLAVSKQGLRAWIDYSIDELSDPYLYEPFGYILGDYWSTDGGYGYSWLHNQMFFLANSSLAQNQRLVLDGQDMGAAFHPLYGYFPGSVSMMDIMDWPHPIAIGTQDAAPKCWLRKDGTWREKVLPHSPEDRNSLLNHATLTQGNDRGQLLLQSHSGPPFMAYLWQNGNTYDLSTLVPATQGSAATWALSSVQDINDHGLIAGTAQKINDDLGNPIPIANQKHHAVLLVPVDINHANGPDIDKPMKYLPRWVPNDGVGKGMPILDTPDSDFQMSAIGSTMQVSFLGASHQLTRNGSNPLLYENTTDGITVTLEAAPLNDNQVQEYLKATVSKSSVGVTSCVYECDETTANSGTFENRPPGVVMAVNGLQAGTVNTMTVKLYGDNSSTDFSLTETAVDSKTFSGGGLTAKLVNNPVLGSSLDVALTYAPRVLSETVIHTTLSSGSYRNFAPAVPTNAGRDPVADNAGFYIEVPVNLAPQGETPKIKLITKVEDEDEEIAEVTLVEMPNGKWRSEKKLVLATHDADENQMLAAEQSAYQVVKWPALAAMDWKQGGGELKVEYAGGKVSVKTQAEGMVLQSLDFVTKFAQGLDPEDRIRKPFQDMGYTMYRDYNAATQKTLDDYVKGKQIWYSMSHGATPDGTSYTPFGGLSFVDSRTAGSITASRLPNDLNYRLVIVDGCTSAHTSTDSESAALQNDDLLPSVKTFADKFGANAAYVGWGWELGPNAAQAWSGEFVGLLKGDTTVQDAYDDFKAASPDPATFRRLLKLYRNGGNKIDLRNSTTP